MASVQEEFHQSKNHSSDKGQESRAYKRYNYFGKASVRPPGGFSDEFGTILDLSLGGCLIRLEEPLQLLLGNEIEINLQSNYLACRAFGTIRRFSEEKHIVGFSFEKLTQNGREDLLRLINDLESGDLGPMNPPIVQACQV